MEANFKLTEDGEFFFQMYSDFVASDAPSSTQLWFNEPVFDVHVLCFTFL